MRVLMIVFIMGTPSNSPSMGRTPNIAEELDEELIKVYIKNLFSLPTPQVLPIEGEMPEGQRGALVVGSLVRIKGQQTIGTIEQINGKNAMVTFGMMRTMTKLSKLEPATQ
mgnify:CR=1 FL=1